VERASGADIKTSERGGCDEWVTTGRGRGGVNADADSGGGTGRMQGGGELHTIRVAQMTSRKGCTFDKGWKVCHVPLCHSMPQHAIYHAIACHIPRHSMPDTCSCFISLRVYLRTEEEASFGYLVEGKVKAQSSAGKCVRRH
jgi:hypothetical protein